MAEYSLDVAFNSATTPLDSTGVIYAMGFGFAESPSGTWKEDGEQVEVVPDGATFYFTIFDTAVNPPQTPAVHLIVITFYDPDNPHIKWDYSPLSVPGSNNNENNPLAVNPTDSAPLLNCGSAGCNVANAACWRIGPYIVKLPKGVPSLILDCTVEVAVEVDPTDPSTVKTFAVDPEIQIEGGG